jgi:hypothetical protein
MNLLPKRKIAISLDIEADGDAPLVNSCLMIGMVAMFTDVEPKPNNHLAEWIVEEKEWCLTEQPNCQPSEKCLKGFWSKYPELKAYIDANAKPVETVMLELSAWLRTLNKTYIIETWVAKPASYDFQWINCLYHKYCPLGLGKTKRFPLPFSITCMSTMYKTLKFLGYTTPEYKNSNLVHTHNALDDARGQGYEYLKMRKDLETKLLIIEKDELKMSEEKAPDNTPSSFDNSDLDVLVANIKQLGDDISTIKFHMEEALHLHIPGDYYKLEEEKIIKLKEFKSLEDQFAKQKYSHQHLIEIFRDHWTQYVKEKSNNKQPWTGLIEDGKLKIPIYEFFTFYEICISLNWNVYLVIPLNMIEIFLLQLGKPKTEMNFNLDDICSLDFDFMKQYLIIERKN